MRRVLSSRLFTAAVALLIGAGAVGVVWALTDDDESKGPKGQVRVVYEPGPRESVELIKRAGVFERAAQTVNREINLTQNLTVSVIGERTAARLNVTGPVYEPSERTVYIPWSFVEQAHDDLVRLTKRSPEAIDRIANVRRLSHKDADRLLQNAMVFVLYHEIAHGLFDILGVAVVGGEEQTADSLAAIFAIVSRYGGQAITLAGATLQLARGEHTGTPALTDFANDHGFDAERGFNALCLVYGSSPRRNRNLVGGPGDLTPQRAELCPFEYRGALASWRWLLGQWLTDRGGLLPLK
jgi:putative metallopeptidase DUF4344